MTRPDTTAPAVDVVRPESTLTVHRHSLRQEEWVEEIYRDPDGLRHRTDGPAQTVERPSGRRTERWFHRDRMIRTDGPVEVDYRDGARTCEMWRTVDHSSEKWHREDGPAVIEYFSDGVTRFAERWYFEGVMHRIGGPAIEMFSNDGTVDDEKWYLDGLCHRIDGPARVERKTNGAPYRSFFELFGQRVASREELGVGLSFLGPEAMRRAIETSSYRVLAAEGVSDEDVARAIAGGVFTAEGIRAVAAGAPAEWARSFELGTTS